VKAKSRLLEASRSPPGRRVTPRSVDLVRVWQAAASCSPCSIRARWLKLARASYPPGGSRPGAPLGNGPIFLDSRSAANRWQPKVVEG